MQPVLARVVDHVLNAERAAPHGVCLLVGVLLAAHAEREPVDEVHGDGLLLRLFVTGLHPLGVVTAHLRDVLLQLARLLVPAILGRWWLRARLLVPVSREERTPS